MKGSSLGVASRFTSGRVLIALAAASAGMSAVAERAAAAIPNYTLIGQFALPGAGGGGGPEGVQFDVAPDGTIWGIVGTTIVRQSTVNGSAYVPVGSVPAGSVEPWGASFFRMSPDGSMIAIGDNRFGASAQVHVVSAASLNTGGASPVMSVACDNYDAAWHGGALYVAGGGSGPSPTVSRVTVDGSSLSATTIIDGVGLASGGVAVQGATLYTGVGWGNGGTPTGQIRGFDLATLTGAPVVNFAAGSVVGAYLSASPIDFDSFGNLLTGGFGGSGAAYVVDLANPGSPLLLSPAGTGAFYGVLFNDVTNELLVTAGGVAYRYAVPAPGAGVALAAFGVLAARRRRCARGQERAS